MLNNSSMDKLESERLKHFPNVNSLLKISLGLILFTIISTTLVYAETISVDIKETSFDIDYTATGMTVTGIEADTQFTSLILTVDVTGSPGTLDITFDRSFFDSTYNGLDDDFFILADADETIFTKTVTPQSKTLSMELPPGTTEIEIIGSVFGALEPETPAETPTELPAEKPEPVTETPTELPAETPTELPAETPAETPTETPTETPRTQCGPGTILKDGECVLDERCGPGTILKDGECVLDATPKSSGTSVKGIGKELIVGVAVAFVIAGVIGIILGIMSKASKNRD